MSDEQFSLTPSAPPPPTEADYEAIAAAVMETVRGRWFLGEYAKRNRHADTELILKGLDRIERMVRERPPELAPAERVRIDLVEMAKAIAQTRAEIAAIKPDGDAKGTLSEATEELDSIVQTTERATSDILAAAEQVQEIAWTLRERGTDGDICDSLDQRATDIYSACSFQDLTGQRTRKVVDVLRFLEDRIRAMIEIWGGAVPDMGAPAAVAAPHLGDDRNVPHLAQGEIDRMMPSARSDAPVPSPNGHDVAAYQGRDRAFTAPAAEDRGVAVDVAASAAPGPAGGIATAEAAMAADRATSGETAMTPIVAVVGATALAVDFAAIEVARQPEPEFQPEPRVEPEARAELEAQAEPEPRAEPEARAEPELQAEPEPRAELELQAELEPQAEPEPQAELELQAGLEPQAEPEPTPAVDAQPEATAQPAAPPEAIAEDDGTPSEQRPDPAAVLKRILAIIRAPNDASAELSATDAPSAAAAAPPFAPAPAPLEIETGQTAAAEAATPAEEPAAAQVPTAPEALITAEALAAAAEAPAAPVAADTVVTDVLTPEAIAVDVAGTADAFPEDSGAQAEEPAAAPTPLPAVSDAPADHTPIAGPLTVDQAVDEMLMRSRPQAPRAPAAAVPSAPTEPIVPIEPQAPEWTAAPAAPAEPIAAEPAPAEAVSPSPAVVIELPELTVARSPEPAPLPAAALAPAPVSQPGPGPEPAVPAVAVAQAAEPGPQATLPEAIPAAAAVAARPPVAAVALAPAADEPPAAPVSAAPPTATPEPVPAAEPPAPALAAIPAPPSRHEALAVITALSDDEKIALFS